MSTMKRDSSASPRLLQLLGDDVPVFDLTTHWLGIGALAGRLCYSVRGAGIVSGIEQVRSLAIAEGAVVENALCDGDRVGPGDRLMEVIGPASALHVVWKTGLNVLEFCSGTATRTRLLVDRVRAINPSCAVFTTRKMIPGSRPWAIAAVLDGGGMPHRLGLSETVLIFDQHKAFFPDRAALAERIRSARSLVCEKKILVEVSTLEEARDFAAVGVDGLQFDKVPTDDLAAWLLELRAEGYRGIAIATGGITADNAAAYAATGVDGIATSWVYHGPGLDIGATIEPA
jgi:molybdenum transport protein